VENEFSRNQVLREFGMNLRESVLVLSGEGRVGHCFLLLDNTLDSVAEMRHRGIWNVEVRGFLIEIEVGERFRVLEI
jgi:hypothetical protein